MPGDTSCSAEALHLPMPRKRKTSTAKIALTTFKKRNFAAIVSYSKLANSDYVMCATQKIKNYTAVAIYLGYASYIARRFNDIGPP